MRASTTLARWSAPRTAPVEPRSSNRLRACPTTSSTRRCRVFCVGDDAKEATRALPDATCVPESRHWSVADSAALYNLQGWGAPYVAASKSLGHVVVRPLGKAGEDGEDDSAPEADLFAIAMEVRARLDSGGPLVLRFPDVACRQAATLRAVFAKAAHTWGYGARFQGVFPVKCCHDKDLLLALVIDGAADGFGLEAGSKPELLLALAVMRRARALQREEPADARPQRDTQVRAHRQDADASLSPPGPPRPSELCGPREPPPPLVVCNGYKDGAYIRLAIGAWSLGVRTVVVLEKPSELPAVIAAVRALPPGALRPYLGVRARLGTTHGGRWGATSGDDAKFGLGAREILWAVHTLAAENMLDCLRLLHFHVGSQVSDIATIKEAMRESSQMYAELVRLGAPMGFVDVGGGLGVDYNGTKGWGGDASTNYDMQNYANDVVAALQDMCTRTGVAPPVVVSESGRAIASAAAVLIFEVTSTEPRGVRTGVAPEPEEASQSREEGSTTTRAAGSASTATLDDLRIMTPSSFLLHNFREVLRSLEMAQHGVGGRSGAANVQESLNDAAQFRTEADRLFKLGIMGLEGRAQAEELFASVRGLAFDLTRRGRGPEGESPPMEVQSALRQPAAWYHANMSVFRSIPDAWAIGQLFPIVPLHRLGEEPTVAGSLADLTCDSDGRVDRFVGPAAASSNGDRGRAVSCLPLHALRAEETYLVAAFLVGAYQDSMGSRGHNLFGSPAVANVCVSPREHSRILKSDEIRFQMGGTTVTVVKGQTTADVLRDAGADPAELLAWARDDASRGGDQSGTGNRSSDQSGASTGSGGQSDARSHNGDQSGTGAGAGGEEVLGRYQEVLFKSYTYLESNENT
uniref:Arginine decarboxylase n=1 Tax=Mantoniella antarctica TaxID=81844 RepID=A0A7S0SGZ5_9CHLO|mmetsp:Transcript_22795/g.56471  ORF Transcript_22795/g.56471 Transcript_22795/m.56471 type:complete len:864 (+) Transcript_22795:242-2833(+)